MSGNNVVYVNEPDPSTIPPEFNKERYIEGYMHGWKSNELINMRRSFVEGFRRAKLEVRDYWKQQGVQSFDNGKHSFRIKST